MKIRTAIFWIFISVHSIASAQSIVYKIADFLRNPIEYRYPFSFSPFEIKAGSEILHMNAIGTDSTEMALLGYDTTKTYFFGYDAIFTNRYMHSVELELAKINLVALLIPQNMLDFQTGVGFRYSTSSQKKELPEIWKQNTAESDDQLYFAPQLMDWHISQSILFQWSQRFYNYIQWNWGKSSASLYKTYEGDRFLKQKGNTHSVAVGFKRLSRIDSNYKDGYGIEIRYTTAKFNDFPDVDDLTPIRTMDFSSLGIYFTFNMINGGSPTQADAAKVQYKRKDYIAAKAGFEEFIASNPSHPRLFKARMMVDRCDYLMAFQQVDLAKQALKKGNRNQASLYLNKAAAIGNPSVAGDLDSCFQVIRSWWQNYLDSLLINNKIEDGIEFLNRTKTLKFPNSDNLKNQYWSEIYFHRGVVFTNYGAWEKAIQFFDLAVGKYPPIKERVTPYLSKVAYGYINDFNLSIDHQSIELALESLRSATEMQPEIGSVTEPYIQTLEDGIQYLKRQAGIDRLKYLVEESRRIPEDSQLTPLIGKTAAIIESELGSPYYKKSLETNKNNVYELWIYKTTGDSGDVYFYFNNNILAKIENPR